MISTLGFKEHINEKSSLNLIRNNFISFFDPLNDRDMLSLYNYKCPNIACADKKIKFKTNGINGFVFLDVDEDDPRIVHANRHKKCINSKKWRLTPANVIYISVPPDKWKILKKALTNPDFDRSYVLDALFGAVYDNILKFNIDSRYTIRYIKQPKTTLNVFNLRLKNVTTQDTLRKVFLSIAKTNKNRS